MSDATTLDDAPGLPDRGARLLLGAVFFAALSGLVYELVAGALSSYLLGDSVTQFSLVIGVFLTSMGIGSWLSRRIVRRLVPALIAIEVLVGVIGGSTALIGFAAFAFTDHVTVILLGQVVVVGTLVGLEIPLVLRILDEVSTLRVNVANVFAVDYVGALAASLAFPFLLLPHLGLVRAGLVAGLLNVVVAMVLLRGLRAHLGRARGALWTLTLASALALAIGTATAGGATRFLEDRVYQDDVILAVDTPLQRLVVTRWRGDLRLYLDGHLQFSSIDEYRYHETLAQPALALADRRSDVLILGGGDGLLAREVLRHADVARVDLVDLDPVVLELFAENPRLVALNGGSLTDPRVTVHARDAMEFLETCDRTFDVILVDLPDPSRVALAKLYSRTFYRLCLRRLSEGGIVATQATSPFRSREAFWCVAETLAATARTVDGEPVRRLHAHPYHTVIPTFGTWGFVLAGDRPRSADLTEEDLELPDGNRYLRAELLPTLFTFPEDMQPVEVEVNDLVDPVIERYYRRGYHRYLE